MNKSLVPLLLEQIAGKKSKEILKEMNERDDLNQQLSASLVEEKGCQINLIWICRILLWNGMSTGFSGVVLQCR